LTAYLWYAGFITYNSPSKFLFFFSPPIVFLFRSQALFYLGIIRRFSLNGTTVSHWRFHDQHRINTCFLNSKFYSYTFKCWILLKPVLEGGDSSLHFLVLSMNKLNQTEPALFLNLPNWTFFKNYYIVLKTKYKPI
jgi:hypothetical protein